MAAWLFHRSSPKYRYWLLNHRLFGPFVKDLAENNAMTRAAKFKSIIALWTVLSISAYFMREYWYLHLILLAVGVGVSGYLLQLKTVKRL
jgi:uncharacterized membrane protein YbaN (DUF454 family)